MLKYLDTSNHLFLHLKEMEDTQIHKQFSIWDKWKINDFRCPNTSNNYDNFTFGINGKLMVLVIPIRTIIII